MSKKFIQRIAGAFLFSACALGYAAEPITLTENQLDSISAGTAVTGPDLSQFSSVGALAWATSTASSTPGLRFILDASVDVQVGLSNNGAVFTHRIRFF